ncbi:hypothetical protein [Ensifer sp. YR511]|uniref:hypothetical protein n=1 Tax=Ensifer sp. YR511 TaxID=1855294 RepID=UPI00159F9FBF|nr:hypothetical protein [Ensifer sp. YR511]
MSDVAFPSDPPSEADTAAPNRIALFAFDEVRRLEIVAINRRRERRDRPPVGVPISADKID